MSGLSLQAPSQSVAEHHVTPSPSASVTQTQPENPQALMDQACAAMEVRLQRRIDERLDAIQRLLEQKVESLFANKSKT